MKALLLSAIVVASAVMVASAGAATGRWCAVYENAEGGKNCYFATHRQCMADLKGKGGFCQRNVRAHSHDKAQYLRY